MNVSILTYHWEDNYGATMQAYATLKIVRKLGHNAALIDLRLPYRPTLRSRLVFGFKRYKFNKFRERYFFSRTPIIYRSVAELRTNPPDSDCYLVGSDQTWNPQIAKHLLPAFFLTFGDEHIRRISYATSIGLNKWEASPFISNDEIRGAIKKFHRILLREDSAVQICKSVFHADATQVIDPVLLFSEYSELTGPLTPTNEIVAYKLIDDSHFYGIGRELARSEGLPIRSIGSVRRITGYRNTYPESVETWISRIASASMVLTDSFHGTVFSLLYHRPFVVYIGDPKRTTRIESLLEQLGLGNRLMTDNSSLDLWRQILHTPIDWYEIDEKLDLLRGMSIQQLRDALA